MYSWWNVSYSPFLDFYSVTFVQELDSSSLSRENKNNYIIKKEKKGNDNNRLPHTGTTSTHSSFGSFLNTWRKEGQQWRQKHHVQHLGDKEGNFVSLLMFAVWETLYSRRAGRYQDLRFWKWERRGCWLRNVCMYVCLLGFVECPVFLFFLTARYLHNK